MKSQIFSILLISLNILGFAQNPIGMPDIVNYDNNVYSAGTHNWDIQQDRNGVMYFANDEGVLTFDGSRWKIYPLPNKTIVRSIKIGFDHKIYAGGQGDFGFFSPNESGKLIFTSLKDKIPSQHRSFADIWNVQSVGKAIFFRAENNIFKWQNEKITVLATKTKWLYMGMANNTIIAHEKDRGLLKLSGNNWLPLLTEAIPYDFMVSSISQFGKDTILVSSFAHGLHTIQAGQITPVKVTNNILNISNARRISPNSISIATLNNGCFLMETNGKLIYHLSKNSGLQNNAVISSFKDHNNNIWLGLADGISFIANNNAIKHINPAIFDNAAGHTSIIYNNKLVVGLSNGIYSLPLSTEKDISATQNNFTAVPNTDGQAWGMNIVNGKLLLGRHEGAFELNEKEVQPVSTAQGYWNFLGYNWQKGTSPLVLAGNYNGISVFNYENNKFNVVGNINNFNESARFLLADNKNNIWVSHPYKGVYKIALADMRTKRVTLYTDKKGLPSTFNNHIYQVKNKIVVGTEKGVYEYNAGKNQFEVSSYFKPVFGSKYIRYLKEDAKGNIWFIEEKKLGVAQYNGKTYKLLYIPELNGKTLGGFEHINCVDQNNVFIGAQKGFYHLNYEKYLANEGKQQVRISLVKAFGKSDIGLFGGYFGEVNENIAQKEIPTIKHGWNSFHFEYSSTTNQNKENTFYSCYLKGFDEKWSALDKKNEKDYTNLPAGHYTFMVKTQDNLGNESPVATYEFTILPPWYQSIVAYLVYGLIFLGIIYLVYKRQQRKITNQRIAFQREQEHTKYMHQLEMDKSEKEIIKLKNEKLELEIETKNSELASNTMHLVQKADMMSKIKNELFKLKKELKDDTQAADFNKIIRLLSAEEKSDESWEQFSVHFDKVHVDFIKHLKDTFPNITGNELRLSAYLKMNLSTKEIATLMKISPRGVEIGRYRLRKKLNIPSHVNLFEFFNAV
ncbi:ligand-binding sensor domain-containing protein [Pedobacter helvus]|uniref:Triple tyrosine motif-containing protein n=1 Tax=Pedobacter helvus TaxID=2563444 RepID=A0ABW9JE75_9SPHI|nr:triple tyrosine motif-containing protein [Pedobacter ureilyticus]